MFFLQPPDQCIRYDVGALVPDEDIVDPDKPLDANLLMAKLIPEGERAPARSHIGLIVSILVSVLALAAAWRWSPLKEWIDVSTLVTLAAEFERAPTAPFITLAIFLLGGLVAFPLTVLIVVCALVFGPWYGFLYSMTGGAIECGLQLWHRPSGRTPHSLALWRKKNQGTEQTPGSARSDDHHYSQDYTARSIHGHQSRCRSVADPFPGFHAGKRSRLAAGDNRHIRFYGSAGCHYPET